jgi:hypothetical protein
MKHISIHVATYIIKFIILKDLTGLRSKPNDYHYPGMLQGYWINQSKKYQKRFSILTQVLYFSFLLLLFTLWWWYHFQCSFIGFVEFSFQLSVKLYFWYLLMSGSSNFKTCHHVSPCIVYLYSVETFIINL